MKMHGPAHSAVSLEQSRAQLVPGGDVGGRRPRVGLIRRRDVPAREGFLRLGAATAVMEFLSSARFVQ